MAAEKYTAAEMIDAAEKSGGVIAVAARILKCSRNTVKRYMREYVTVGEAFADANETNLDAAEGSLLQFVRGIVTETDSEGKRTTTRVDHRVQMDALKFYLRTKGRTRGYGDRIEHAGDPAAPVFPPYPEKTG